jgi:hypothetical protein
MRQKKVEGFPDYSVNTLGQVRRDESGYILIPQVNQYGQVFVGLMLETKQHFRSLPLLVARAFLKPPGPAYDTPINLDGDKFNCKVENLRWRPRAFARKYNLQFREHMFDTLNEPIQESETKEIFANSWEAATHFGLIEKDVVLSILENTVTWPTFQRFARV